MKFILLTDRLKKSDKVVVNADCIKLIVREEDKTIVIFDDTHLVYVTETPQEIYALLRKNFGRNTINE